MTVKGNKIKKLREELHLSAERLGIDCGYGSSYIRAIESGETGATDGFLEKVAGVFAVEIDWLLDDAAPVVPVKWKNERPDSTPGERLRQVLDESDLSQRQFCKAIGTSTSMIGPLFDGRKQITERFAAKVEKLGYGRRWILYGDERSKNVPLSDEMVEFLQENEEARRVVKRMMEKAAKPQMERSIEDGKKAA